jgi:diguanylate cyclase (GGDEF)-like protein
MKPHLWTHAIANLVLGQEPPLRRHVLFVLVTLIPYSVSVGVILHSHYLGLLDQAVTRALVLASLTTFLVFFALVRSGWSRRAKDPVLTYPHALVTVSLCLAAYTVLGAHRANTVILIAQTIVLSMFRLRPAQVLTLGVYTVATLAACVFYLSLTDPAHYPASTSWSHFTVGGSTLLMLSLIGKWISDIRVRIGRQAAELAEAVQTVQQMATTDMLTGLLNRRMMTDLLESELRLIQRTGAPLCVALLDIDHFKSVNDQFGHHAGDIVLKGVARHAMPQLRQVDKIGRWGGEEFLLMFPRIGDEDTLAAMERLRVAIEGLRYPEHHTLQVTFSAGIARAQAGETLERLLERADEALYAAKHQGRNRCVVAAQPADAPPIPATAGTAASPVLTSTTSGVPL